MSLFVFMLNIPPTTKIIMEVGPRLKGSSDRLEKLGIKPVTPSFQGKQFIHFYKCNYKESCRSYTESCRSYTESCRSYTESFRSYTESCRSYTESCRSYSSFRRSSNFLLTCTSNLINLNLVFCCLQINSLDPD